MKTMKEIAQNLSWPNTRSRISSDQRVWGARRAFTSATSAGVNVHEAALTLLRTWSSVVAPEMTEQTCGWARSHAWASSFRPRLRAAAQVVKRLSRAKLAMVMYFCTRGLVSPREPGGGGSPRRYLPVKKPPARG